MHCGAEVCAVPIPMHGSSGDEAENKRPEPVMFTAIFSDTANAETCSFQQDLVGPILHFHRCASPSKVVDCSNRCLIESHSWYQVVFSQTGKQRDPPKCWLNSDLRSSCVLVNHCYHNIHSKVMDNDVLDFFLKKRSVSIHEDH